MLGGGLEFDSVSLGGDLYDFTNILVLGVLV
jgi:hypothetical protein